MASLDPRVAGRFPLLLSFFCGGIPSHKGTDRILDDLGVKKTDLADFRYRGDGWPGYATATRRDGSVSRMTYMESWGGRLSHHVQFRCKFCPDAVGGVADVVCADAWYGDEKGYPLFEESDGRSLVIARTEIGERLIAGAQSRNRIALETSSIGEIVKMQPSQAWRKRLALSRLVAMAVCLHPRPRTTGVQVLAAARSARIGETIKSFLGLIRRIAQQRK
jgi:coenzyme F420 hydrogenase subunit beta